jgi:hypothetical protein
MKRRTVVTAAITAASTLGGCVTSNDASGSTVQSKGDTRENTPDSTIDTDRNTKPDRSQSRKPTPTETDIDWSNCGGKSRISVYLPATVPNGTSIHEYEASKVKKIPRLDTVLERAEERYSPGMEDGLEQREALAASWSEGSFEDAEEIRNAIGYHEDYYLRYDDTVYVLRYSVMEC